MTFEEVKKGLEECDKYFRDLEKNDPEGYKRKLMSMGLMDRNGKLYEDYDDDEISPDDFE
ncbi:MAG: hypothetical protein LBU03_00655 [Tannerellaceae bacterium]|jgi:hypothetical protein|nr:hypothetical protein [Tannerellaceae bacterium]